MTYISKARRKRTYVNTMWIRAVRKRVRTRATTIFDHKIETKVTINSGYKNIYSKVCVKKRLVEKIN